MTKPADVTAKAREQFKCIQCAGSGRVMMGALTSAVCPKCDGFCSKRLTLSEIVEALASERSSAIKEAREDCARAVCVACAQGAEVERVNDSYWLHPKTAIGHYRCTAAGIRDLIRGEG